MGRTGLSVFGLLWISALPLSAEPLDNASLKNPTRAKFNWMMNCQGCHGVEGQGSETGAPPMPGVLDKFMAVDGGREYLIRVPGVANAPLSDPELADLVNWVLIQYACAPAPNNFPPYNAEEVSQLRREVLIRQAEPTRIKLLKRHKTENSNNRIDVKETAEIGRDENADKEQTGLCVTNS